MVCRDVTDDIGLVSRAKVLLFFEITIKNWRIYSMGGRQSKELKTQYGF